MSHFTSHLQGAFRPLSKEADITSTLRPHQERVRDRMRNGKGLVVAHDMGSGKTLSSIAVAEDEREKNPSARVRAIVPAALRENYRKEIEKHTDGGLTGGDPEVLSHTRATLDGVDEEEADLVIVDEAHRARSVGSKLKGVLRDSPAEKRVLMTGTPVYNHPYELSPLVNMAAGRSILPETPGDFERRFVENREVYPEGLKGLAYRLTGGTPGIRQTLKGDKRLRDAVREHVDYHKPEQNSEDFPDVEEERVRVPMSERQRQVYDYMFRDLPRHLRKKVQEDLPPNKQEASKLVSFLSGPRQVANSVHGFDENLSALEAGEDSPKIQKIIESIESDPDKPRLIYSNYVGSALEPLQASLSDRGVDYGVYTGSANHKKREEDVRRFNDGDLSTLIVSSAGAEGLDLKGVREVHIMEPHWNEQKIKQVAARANRYKSHDHLPEEERNLKILRYETERPENSVANGLRRLVGRPLKKQDTVESYIKSRADEKQELNDQIVRLLQEETDRYTEGGKTASHSYLGSAFRSLSKKASSYATQKNASKSASKKKEASPVTSAPEAEHQDLVGDAGRVAAGGAVGAWGLRKGLPMLSGMELQSHTTSKGTAKEILRDGYLDPSKGGTGAAELNPQFQKASKGYAHITGQSPESSNLAQRILGDRSSRKSQERMYASVVGLKDKYPDLGFNEIMAKSMKGETGTTKAKTLYTALPDSVYARDFIPDEDSGGMAMKTKKKVPVYRTRTRAILEGLKRHGAKGIKDAPGRVAAGAGILGTAGAIAHALATDNNAAENIAREGWASISSAGKNTSRDAKTASEAPDWQSPGLLQSMRNAFNTFLDRPVEEIQNTYDQPEPVESSNLKAVGYDPSQKKLRVQFQSGGDYAYRHVPSSTYQSLMNADSKGRNFHQNIRGRYAHAKLASCYPMLKTAFDSSFTSLGDDDTVYSTYDWTNRDKDFAKQRLDEIESHYPGAEVDFKVSTPVGGGAFAVRENKGVSIDEARKSVLSGWDDEFSRGHIGAKLNLSDLKYDEEKELLKARRHNKKVKKKNEAQDQRYARGGALGGMALGGLAGLAAARFAKAKGVNKAVGGAVGTLLGGGAGARVGEAVSKRNHAKKKPTDALDKAFFEAAYEKKAARRLKNRNLSQSKRSRQAKNIQTTMVQRNPGGSIAVKSIKKPSASTSRGRSPEARRKRNAQAARETLRRRTDDFIRERRQAQKGVGAKAKDLADNAGKSVAKGAKSTAQGVGSALKTLGIGGALLGRKAARGVGLLRKVAASDDDVIERLAALEHQQWMSWVDSLPRNPDNVVPAMKNRTKKWEKNMIPYDQLPEDEKRKDRLWATRALRIVRDAEKEKTASKGGETASKKPGGKQEGYWNLNADFDNPYHMGAYSKREGEDNLAVSTFSGSGKAIGAGALATSAIKGVTGQSPTSTTAKLVRGGSENLDKNLDEVIGKAKNYYKNESKLHKGSKTFFNQLARGRRMTEAIADGAREVNWKKVAPKAVAGGLGGVALGFGLNAARNAAAYGAGHALTKGPGQEAREEKTAGGPGSGVSHNNTSSINMDARGVERSDLVSLHTRKRIMKSQSPDKKANVPLSKIGRIAQGKYVISKLSWFMKNKEKWRDKPVKLLWDAENNTYHLMDGHHRWLAASRLGMESLPAEVWRLPITSKGGRRSVSIPENTKTASLKGLRRAADNVTEFATGSSGKAVDYAGAAGVLGLGGWGGVQPGAPGESKHGHRTGSKSARTSHRKGALALCP